MFWRLVIGLAAAVVGCPGAHAATADDPLQSATWADLRKTYFGDAKMVFDPRVKVVAPERAEDSMNVPVGIDAQELGRVEEIVVVADHNPIIKVLSFEPLASKAVLSFRVKLQQATPVRAVARTPDGVWHVGGMWVDAAGGGCTAPSVGRGDGSWAQTLGQVQARVWERGDLVRVRVRVSHPMDTGLAPGIPAFYIERLAVKDASGREYLRLQTFEPVSENPVFSFDFPAGAKPAMPLFVSGTDNNGNLINARVSP